MTVVFDPVVTRIAAATVAIVLLLGAWQKLRDIETFRSVLADYALLPGALLGPMSWLLPTIEASAGFALVIEPWRGYGAAAAMLLLVLVTAGVVVNLRRGRTHISCGCGGIEGEQSLSWTLVLRNAALLLVIAISAAETSTRALVSLDYWTVAAGSACLYGIYVAASQLIANQPRLVRLRSLR